MLGFIGFVRAWHHLESLIRGLAGMAPNISLVVAGDGPARRDLGGIAEALGCSGRVRFTGLVAREDVPQTLAGFDIALQPHALAYGSPLKLFEYMAAGLAIVAPDQPNIREVVVTERCGRPSSVSSLIQRSESASVGRPVKRFTDGNLPGTETRNALLRSLRSISWAAAAGSEGAIERTGVWAETSAPCLSELCCGWGTDALCHPRKTLWPGLPARGDRDGWRSLLPDPPFA